MKTSEGTAKTFGKLEGVSRKVFDVFVLSPGRSWVCACNLCGEIPLFFALFGFVRLVFSVKTWGGTVKTFGKLEGVPRKALTCLFCLWAVLCVCL